MTAGGHVGAIYGLILFRVLLRFVVYVEVAVLLTAATVGFSVAALSRYRRSLLDARKSRVWLPALLGALAGGVAGVAVVWLQVPGSWLPTFLPLGGLRAGWHLS
jgi:hypothetical protein